MIIGKRRPPTEALNFIALFDQVLTSHLETGATEDEARFTAQTVCRATWLKQNPIRWPIAELEDDPKGCCHCGNAGGYLEPVAPLGAGIRIHHACRDDFWADLVILADAGLIFEGLRFNQEQP